jgi:hypothetical protein
MKTLVPYERAYLKPCFSNCGTTAARLWCHGLWYHCGSCERGLSVFIRARLWTVTWDSSIQIHVLTTYFCKTHSCFLGRGIKFLIIRSWQWEEMGPETWVTSNQLTRLIAWGDSVKLRQILMKQSMRVWTYSAQRQDFANTMNLRVPEKRGIWLAERLFSSSRRTLLHGVDTYNTPYPS